MKLIVVPHEGTWIEMYRSMQSKECIKVVPHEGTWIEISWNAEVL